MANKARPSKEGPSIYLVGAICLFILAAVLMGIAVQRGEARVGLFLIFPFISGGGLFMGLGLLFVIFGIIVLVLGAMKGFTIMAMDQMVIDELEEPQGPSKRRAKSKPRTVGDEEVPARRITSGFPSSGVVFIGPVPIVFGPNAKVTKLMLYLSIVLVIGVCLLFFVLSFRGL
jgi:uncharacterized protein (TIGR00304 family)